MRDYNKGYLPFAWRGWWDFGTGALGDMGCHIMDMPFWALDLRAPTAIRALMGAGNDWVEKHDLSDLRVLGSVGEPINPAARQQSTPLKSILKAQPGERAETHSGGVFF